MSIKKKHLLEIDNFHMTSSSAKKAVAKELLECGYASPKGGWEKFSLKIGENKRTFNEMVKTARETGITPYYLNLISNGDDVFEGFRIGISSPSESFNTLTATYAGFKKTLKFPASHKPAEYEIVKDILFYREECALYSDEYDFEFCTRYYRAYLSTCISLIDAFINRHILVYKHNEFKIDEVKELEKIINLEDKIELFLKISCGKELASINGGVEWKDFKSLKKMRNEIIHINEPSLGYNISEFAEHLNYVRNGVGGLLLKIRKAQNKKTLGFIEQLRTAPKVNYKKLQ
ncbi:hypothetical protein [Flavobacterium oreochromis]|uniref:Uncharacterized protein n=1 Tax=Flavobacterium columnare TaxID=996 RepID=A0A246G7K3_9FLAO|nr:hypothetical protein [Flavobacterium oreochromis]OWP74501.1 hypothetical protein BWK62_14200 [Flavobacterium oreochromis]